MANLAEARRQFVKLTGRYDLLVGADISLNTDNGANAYINSAKRHLNALVRRDDLLRREVLLLPASTILIETEHLLSIKSLRAINSDGAVQPGQWKDLTTFYSPYDEFRAVTPALITEWVTGALSGWTLVPGYLAPKTRKETVPAAALDQGMGIIAVPQASTTEHVFNSGFGETFIVSSLDRPIGWSINNSEWWVVAGALTTPLATTAVSQSLSDMAIVLKPSTRYSVTLNVTLSAGSLTVAVGSSTPSASITSTGIYTFELVTAAAPLLGVVITPTIFTGSINSVSVTEKVVDPEKISVDLYKNKGIMFYPAPDAAHTIEIVGRFAEQPLTEDGDVDYWTERYIDLLVKKAAQLYYEELGNTARMQHFDEACNRWIQIIDSDEVEFEMTGLEMEMER